MQARIRAAAESPSSCNREGMTIRSHVESVLPCELPVVQAPMAGGPSTPELAAAVSDAGGFSYVAAGYLTTDALRAALDRTRTLTAAPIGVNVFVPGRPDADADAIAAYAASLQPAAARFGVALGKPRWEDDAYRAKIDLLADAGVHTVSFTFGCPEPGVIDQLHAAGVRIAVTVTNAAEAGQAESAGADSLIVQGTEAGGHQGTFDPSAPNHTLLLDAFAAIRDAARLPLIAAGGIMTADDARTALDAGAIAVQLGTALLLTPEAGTSRPYREALATARYPDTVLTRAYTGRWARGLANRFAREHDNAPGGYPQIHHLTRPMRAAATNAGDSEVPNLWAGTRWRAAVAEPAGDVVRRIGANAGLTRIAAGECHQLVDRRGVGCDFHRRTEHPARRQVTSVLRLCVDGLDDVGGQRLAVADGRAEVPRVDHQIEDHLAEVLTSGSRAAGQLDRAIQRIAGAECVCRRDGGLVP